jgi:hypothetical protein
MTANEEPTQGLVSMGVPPPVPFSELPVEVQAEAIANGDVAPLDYDG